MLKPPCKQFAELMVRESGTTYRKVATKYPRAAHANAVYVNGCETQEGHCIHCARVEAVLKYGMDGKPSR